MISQDWLHDFFKWKNSTQLSDSTILIKVYVDCKTASEEERNEENIFLRSFCLLLDILVLKCYEFGRNNLNNSWNIVSQHLRLFNVKRSFGVEKLQNWRTRLKQILSSTRIGEEEGFTLKTRLNGRVYSEKVYFSTNLFSLQLFSSFLSFFCLYIIWFLCKKYRFDKLAGKSIDRRRIQIVRLSWQTTECLALPCRYFQLSYTMSDHSSFVK